MRAAHLGGAQTVSGANDGMAAMDAIAEAQRIVFAPIFFQAVSCLRDFGILAYIDDQGDRGATLDEILSVSALDSYAAELLLDVGVSGRVFLKSGDRYFSSKLAFYLLHDGMTRVNMDFVRDVCYRGMDYLGESLERKEAVGLKEVFGIGPTIYPALSRLPEPARGSWFAFDHFYSEAAFGAALSHVLSLHPGVLYDVGGNTGNWALRCCRHDDDLSVVILDLPEQIDLARQRIAGDAVADRIGFQALDILADDPLPGQADIWWMSQFLDCFSPEQIVRILKRIAQAIRPGARLCIMDLFWDAQKFEVASFSLNAISLYFTCMANGCSRFYSVESFEKFLEQAGFRIERRIDGLGVGHSLLICVKA